MRLIIIEDEKDLVRPVKRYLQKTGFIVDCAYDGKSGLDKIRINSYDCILLDLNLPKLDGLSLSRELRQSNDTTPIIMVTAKSQIYDKLEGFEHGADDYVTKPFNLKELTARINSVITRNSRNKQKFLHFGTMKVDPKNNTVMKTTPSNSDNNNNSYSDNNRSTDIQKKKNSNTLNDHNDIPNSTRSEHVKQANTASTTKKITLTTKEMGILEYLLRHTGEIVSTEKLLEHVWGNEVDMFTSTIKTHIKTLRQKIDPDKKLLQTVRGKGYIIKK